jgi:hypothetical protein
MRKLGVVAVLGIAVVATGSSYARCKASLRVVREGPLAIRGDHFRAREHVRVTTGAWTRRAVASRNGVFVVTVRGATRCDVVRVLARGSGGSYAVLKLLPSPECLPASSR